MVSRSWGPRVPPWNLVPQSLCLISIWAGLEKSSLLCYLACSNASATVEAGLLWLTQRDSRSKADPGSATAGGSREVPGKVLPGRVMYLPRPFSFQSDITTVRSRRTTLTHQSCVTAASTWQLLRVFISRSGVPGSEGKCWLSCGERAVGSRPSERHWPACRCAGRLPEHQQRRRGPWASRTAGAGVQRELVLQEPLEIKQIPPQRNESPSGSVSLIF